MHTKTRSLHKNRRERKTPHQKTPFREEKTPREGETPFREGKKPNPELPDHFELHGQIVRLILPAQRIMLYPRLHAAGKHACQGLARMVTGAKI